MLYVRCPTCRSLFAHKQILYENAMENICNDQNLSEIEKGHQKSKVLDDLNIIKQCCRARFLTYVQLIDIVK